MSLSRDNSAMRYEIETANDHFIWLLYITEKRVSADHAKQIVESVFPEIKPESKELAAT